MTSSQAEVLGIGFLLAWFAGETLWDVFKSLVLPLWLVLPPVLAGVLYQFVFGEWYFAAAMLAALVLHLSDKLVVRAFGTVLLLAASAAAANWALAAGLVLFWALWEVSVAGGADALAAYAALMVAPCWEMLGFLLAGIFLWALGIMLVVYRRQFAQRWRRFAWRVIQRDLPTEKELVAEGKPTIGGIWLGTVFFALWRLLL